MTEAGEVPLSTNRLGTVFSPRQERPAPARRSRRSGGRSHWQVERSRPDRAAYQGGLPRAPSIVKMDLSAAKTSYGLRARFGHPDLTRRRASHSAAVAGANGGRSRGGGADRGARGPRANVGSLRTQLLAQSLSRRETHRHPELPYRGEWPRPHASPAPAHQCDDLLWKTEVAGYSPRFATRVCSE